ncbi:hypothetical protein [Gillisia sp. CAL575]|uniref:hypothetical protein n=1 Tax=Gillisia sp. CAL575 TaxID=985255 RepID=UPI0003A80646|nr:hypothetical protein [Gillisia sp. CAL575]
MKHYFKLVKNRIGSIRKDLFLLLIISVITIIIIEFWLINIPASNDFFYHLGQINLKLSYSYFSAFIFYFLVIHSPKEKRKAKSFRQLNNKILAIDYELRDIITTALDAANYKYKDKLNFSVKKLSKEDFKQACKKVNPQNPIKSNIHYPPFSDWFEFLTFKGKEIKKLINEILLINDSIDSEVLELITFVDDETSRFIYERKKFGNTDLENLSVSIYTTSEEVNELISVFRKKYNRYKYEYHYNYRLRNKKQKASP